MRKQARLAGRLLPNANKRKKKEKKRKSIVGRNAAAGQAAAQSPRRARAGRCLRPNLPCSLGITPASPAVLRLATKSCIACIRVVGRLSSAKLCMTAKRSANCIDEQLCCSAATIACASIGTQGTLRTEGLDALGSTDELECEAVGLTIIFWGGGAPKYGIFCIFLLCLVDGLQTDLTQLYIHHSSQASALLQVCSV